MLNLLKRLLPHRERVSTHSNNTGLGCEIKLDCAAKFYHSIYIAGNFSAAGQKLKRVTLKTEGVINELASVKKTSPTRNFSLQVMLKENYFPDDAILVFETDRQTFTARLGDLCNQKLCSIKSNQQQLKFMEYLASVKNPKMLDVGGRDRSKVDRSKFFPNVDVTVLDILPGDNVDVVGDAHSLTKYFPANHFDAIYSVSVFEHLLMPWKVVLEMNRVMKPGAWGLVFTHQTLGVHDAPWDFWRFSDNAWDALFNKKTGFEIIERSLDLNEFILPYICRADKRSAEDSPGFEGSCVIFKKIGEPQVEWTAELPEIIKTIYPSNKE